jgi:hypothetical protein
MSKDGIFKLSILTCFHSIDSFTLIKKGRPTGTPDATPTVFLHFGIEQCQPTQAVPAQWSLIVTAVMLPTASRTHEFHPLATAVLEVIPEQRRVPWVEHLVVLGEDTEHFADPLTVERPHVVPEQLEGKQVPDERVVDRRLRPDEHIEVCKRVDKHQLPRFRLQQIYGAPRKTSAERQTRQDARAAKTLGFRQVIPRLRDLAADGSKLRVGGRLRRPNTVAGVLHHHEVRVRVNLCQELGNVEEATSRSTIPVQEDDRRSERRVHRRRLVQVVLSGNTVGEAHILVGKVDVGMVAGPPSSLIPGSLKKARGILDEFAGDSHAVPGKHQQIRDDDAKELCDDANCCGKERKSGEEGEGKKPSGADSYDSRPNYYYCRKEVECLEWDHRHLEHTDTSEDWIDS